MGRVIHFEIHAENPERAVAFYEKLLAWQFQKWDGPMDYWLVSTGDQAQPGINGGLVRRHGPGPAEMQAVNSYVCTAGVDQLDPLLALVPTIGGSIALPKMPVPGIGWLAYVKDTEGNLLGLMQTDPAAK
jgi:predicted enzyme related to lactoylglutathione lyase